MRTVVDPQVPLGRRIVLVVDRSGSMRGAPFDRLVGLVDEVIESPADDFEVKVLAFAADSWWNPAGWVKMPDRDAVAALQRWLTGLRCDGSTLAGRAMRTAFNEPRADTVVIFSDGVFDDAVDGVAGSGKVVASVCIGKEQDSMDRIGRDGRGGAFVEEEA